MPHRHLSFANVTSLSALVFAMGGTGYALTIPKNSVGSSQIKAKAVKKSELGSSAVSSSKVKNGSLLATDFKIGELPAGPQGATGSTGAQGPAGPPASTIVRRTDIALPAGPGVGMPGVVTSAFATCGPGERIVGGSSNVSNNPTPPTMELLASRPSVDNVGNGTVPTDGQAYAYWKGTGRTLTNVAGAELRVFAICAVP